MTISKKTHESEYDYGSRHRIIFNLSALVFTFVLGILIFLLLPSKAGYPAITNEIPKPASNIDNSNLEIPVLMYHYIRTVTDPSDTTGMNLSVSPAVFESQIHWLKENGYQSITFNKALKLFNNEEAITAKPVIITFDDGHNDAYSAAMPVLKENDYVGVFYIVSGFLNKPQFLTNDDIISMNKSGMVIGDHTTSHLDLSTLNEAKAELQIDDCKLSLESLISIPVTDFAYPSGKYNANTIEILKSIGVKTAVTTKNGIWKSTDNVYEIPRIRMTESTNLSNILK